MGQTRTQIQGWWDAWQCASQAWPVAICSTNRRSGGFPYLRVGFGWETGFLAPLVSKGCLGVVPINYQTLSLWL